MRTLPLVSVAASAVATLLVTGSGLAQAQAQGQAAVGTQPQATAGMALPGQAAAVAGDSDHDAMVGRLAVGYLGRRSLAIYGMDPAPGLRPLARDELEAPVVGVRYWIDPMLGIDVGLGFMTSSGSTEIDVPPAPPLDLDDPSQFAVIIHGGVPLSLAAADHFSFQVVPELNVGYGQSSLEWTDGAGVRTDTTDSGIHIDVGARVGAEIHFGFMGIPQLSLQGSVGVRLDWDSLKDEQDVTPVPPAAPSTNTTSWSGIHVATAVYDNPWNIFISNVAALYYF